MPVRRHFGVDRVDLIGHSYVGMTLLLPNARLLTVERAAHAPWVEAPEEVLGSIGAFLDGTWPEGVQKVKE